jgi:hypothetical protein
MGTKIGKEMHVPLNNWNIIECNIDVLVRIIIRNESWLKLHNKPLAGILQVRFKPIIINTENSY